VRSGLWAQGFRFRLHARLLPGRPDLVLPKWRTAIFVNGCFWHAHANCSYFRLPTSRSEFWDAKLQSNRRRDATSVARLVEGGWKVITIWECALRLDPAEAVMLAAGLIRDTTGPCWEIRQVPSNHDTCHIQAVNTANACPVSPSATIARHPSS
jgi:DNA mismatch endonuclease, patch repair protein